MCQRALNSPFAFQEMALQEWDHSVRVPKLEFVFSDKGVFQNEWPAYVLADVFWLTGG